MSNNRIYYAVQRVGIKPVSTPTSNYNTLFGIQSIGINTNFNLEQVFEVGQLSIYENIEEIPDVEISLTKVLDGCPLIFTRATEDASQPTLVNRVDRTSILGLGIYNDTDALSDGPPVSCVQCSGLYVNNLSYNFSIEDNFTEDVTLVGNHKAWLNDDNIVNASNIIDSDTNNFDSAFSDGDTEPCVGVQRRQDIIYTYDAEEGWTGLTEDELDALTEDELSALGTGSVPIDANSMVSDVDTTILPPEVYGISASGTNELANGQYSAHITNITISADLGRENISELGRKGPYYRNASYPIEVTCEIEAIGVSGDLVSATEDGILSTASTCGSNNNLTARTIRVATCDGTRIYLGQNNKLSSVNYSGGESGGSNVTISYTYTTYNDLTVMHTGDPNTNFDSSDIAIRRTYLR